MLRTTKKQHVRQRSVKSSFCIVNNFLDSLENSGYTKR